MNKLPVLTGKELRLFRTFKGLGQKNVAAALCISQPAYSKWESSDLLSSKKISRLRDIFGPELNELCDLLQMTDKDNKLYHV